MKKLLFLFVAVVAMSFASCGNKPAEAPVEEAAVDSVVEETVDSLAEEAVDSVAEEVAPAEEEAPAAE